MLGTGAGEAIFTIPDTYEFFVPSGVSNICIAAVGGGGAGDDGNTGDGGGNGGNGGGFVYANSIAVSPGQSIICTVGAGGEGGLEQHGIQAPSGENTVVSFNNITLTAFGGAGGLKYGSANPSVSSGTIVGTTGIVSNGGLGGRGYNGGGGGGGAGGFAQDGSVGSEAISSYNPSPPTSTVYAGGGGGAQSSSSISTYAGSGGIGQADTTGGGGGGAALFTNPAIILTGADGGDGNGNKTGISQGGAGGFPGGGGGGSYDNGTGLTSAGGNGAIRIIWGYDRVFPTSINEPPDTSDYTFSKTVYLNGIMK